MSHLTQAMVEQFFEAEKENARCVLRKRMDSCMDTIFAQMKRKLMTLVESVGGTNETGHGLVNLSAQVLAEPQQNLISNGINLLPPATTNSQPLVNVLNVLNPFQIYQIKLNNNNSIDTSNKPTALSIPTNSTQFSITQSNVSNANLPKTRSKQNPKVPDKTSNLIQNDEIIIKEEFDEIVNIIPNENPSIATCSASQAGPSNDDLIDVLDEEDCDCPQCVGDLFVKDWKMEDFDDDVQLFEDFDESNDSNPLPNKRPRLDQSQADQAESNNQTNHNRYITVSLKCPQCSEMYQDRSALIVHQDAVHSIKKYRCLYKDCNKTFDRRNNFGHHLHTAHKAEPETAWPCSFCTRTFKNNNYLLSHHLKLHEEGLFRCSYPECQFEGNLKQTVHNHYMFSHKGLLCPFPGCERRYQQTYELKQHERTHRTDKPYRCKLPECTYDSAYKAGALGHIRRHLKTVQRQNKRSKNYYVNMSDNPHDYLEVVHELL